MANLTRSGDIFRLGAAGEFDGLWLTSGKLRAGAGISYSGGVEFCHGLDVAIGIEASADIEGALTVFLPSVQAEGKALAAAGAGVRAQLAPNLFDKAGLTVDVHAFAQASVAGRIAIGLEFTEIANIAEGLLDDLSYKLFITFINELSIQAGVWGRASFAAMAEAHLEVNGTVLGEKPGFQWAMGGGAGWGGGSAWDYFAKAPIENPRRLFTSCAEILIDELAMHARQRLDPEYMQAIEAFEFVAPIAAVTAYDLGEMASEEILRPANQTVRPFLQAFSQRVALYTLDKLVEVGSERLTNLMLDTLVRLTQSPIPEADRQALLADIDAAIDIVSGGPLDLDKAVEVLTPLTDILSVLAPDLMASWEDDIAILWSAAVTGRALRRTAAKAEVTLNVLGLNATVSGSAMSIPPAPQAVRRAYDRHFDPTPTDIGFDDVIDYLTERSLGAMLERHVPQIDATLGQVAGILDISIGDLVEATLTGAIGEDLSEVDLYIKLRDFCKTSIESVVLNELVPELKFALSDTPDAVRYVDDVVVPVLAGTSHFAFDQLDSLVGGMSVAEFDPFNASFKAGLGDLVWLLFSRNVVFLTDIMLDKTIDGLNSGLMELEDSVRNDSGDVMIAAALDLGESSFPGFSPVDPVHAEALRDLVADLLSAGATAFGPAIWTHTRRERLKSLIHRLLERGAVADYSAHDELNAALNELAKCYYVPDVVGLKLLLNELGGLTSDEFEVVVERVAPAFEVFFLKLTTSSLETVENTVVAFIGEVADRLREALETLEAVRQALTDIAQSIAELGGDAAAALIAIATELGSVDWRATVLNALFARGMDIAEANLRATPGFDSQPADVQEAQVDAARSTFDGAYSVVRPALDLAMQIGGSHVVTASQVVDTTTSAPLAADNFVARLTADIRAQIEAAGIPLPSELSITQIETTIIGALNTSAFRTLVDTYVVAKQAELDATAERDRLEDEEARLEAEAAEARAARTRQIGTMPSVEIISPAPMDSKHGFVYPRVVPIYARISGARASYLEPGSPSRTMVRLNGLEIDIPRSAWSYDSGARTLMLNSLIESGLLAGINTLEVSIADGVAAPVRQSVSFLANPALEPRGGMLRIAEELSQFDTPGNDHQATTQEVVTLQNMGDQPVALEGLRVADRVGHVYIFDQHLLQPGGIIRLHTGSGIDDTDDVFWGRGAAVWNNRGDTVYVYDKDRVLWVEFSY